MPRRCRTALSLASLLTAICVAAVPSLTAQETEASSSESSWQGGVGIAILVRDQRGAGVPGARVRLSRAAGEGGPGAAYTDDTGRLEVDGLAAGEWQIDVRREGYMIYTGYLNLEMGEMPKVGFSSRQRTGTFWAELDVAFAPAGASAELFASDSKQAKAARRRQERELKAASREREREERLASRGDLALVVSAEPLDDAEEESVESAEAAPEPAAPTPTPTATTPTPTELKSEPEGRTPEASAAPTPSAAPRGDTVAQAASAEVAATEDVVEDVGEEEAVDRDEVARISPDESPLPAGDPPPGEGTPPTTTATPAASPVERRGAPAEPSAEATLLPAGTCRECGPGEWAASSPVRAQPRGDATPGCPGRLERRLAEVGELLAELPGGAALAGPLWDRDGDGALRGLPRDTVVNLRSRIEALSGPSRSCVLAAVVIPAGSRYVGYGYAASDDGGEGGCRANVPCPIGQAQWLGDPVVVAGENGAPTLVWAVFDNESRDRARNAELAVYFEPPDGWQPAP